MPTKSLLQCSASGASHACRPTGVAFALCAVLFCTPLAARAADDDSTGPATALLTGIEIETVTIDEDVPLGAVVLHEWRSAQGYTDFQIESGNEDAIFCIDPHTGRLLVASDGELDFEQRAEYIVVVSAREQSSKAIAFEDDFEASLLDAGLAPRQLERLRNRRRELHVVVMLRDVNEPPIVQNARFEIPESATNGDVIGQVLAADPDSDDSLHYSVKLGGFAEPAVTIDETTGRIVVADATQFDFEQVQNHSLTVQVRDSSGHVVSAAVEVAVKDVNEPPVLAPIDLHATVTSAGTSPVGAIVVHDDDGQNTLAFDLLDDPTNGGFSIDSRTGVMSVADASLLQAFDGSNCSLTVNVWDDACNCLTVTFDVQIDLPTPIPLPAQLADGNTNPSHAAEQHAEATPQISLLSTAQDVLSSLSIVTGLVWVFAVLVVRGQRHQPKLTNDCYPSTSIDKANDSASADVQEADVLSESTTVAGVLQACDPNEVVVCESEFALEDSTLSGPDRDDASSKTGEPDAGAFVASAPGKNTVADRGTRNEKSIASPVSKTEQTSGSAYRDNAPTIAPDPTSDWLATMPSTESSDFPASMSQTVVADRKVAADNDATAELNDSTLLELLEASRIYAENEPAAEPSSTYVEDSFDAASNTVEAADMDRPTDATPAADSEFPYAELSDTLKQLVRPEAMQKVPTEFDVGSEDPSPDYQSSAATETTFEDVSEHSTAFEAVPHETPASEYEVESGDSIEDCDRAVREHLAALFRRVNGDDDANSAARSSVSEGASSPAVAAAASPDQRAHATSGDEPAPLIDGINEESRRVPRELLRNNTALFRELSKRSADAAISTASHRRSQLATKPRLVFMGLLVLGSVGWIAASVLGNAQFGNIGKLLVLSAMASMAEFSYCVYRLTPSSDMPAESEADAAAEVVEE